MTHSTDIIEVAENILMCPGSRKGNAYFTPQSSGCYTVREDDTVFVIDSGAGINQRNMIIQAVKRIKGDAEKLVLINTHAHVDHICNNKYIMEIDGFKSKHHYLHESGKCCLDPYNYLSLHQEIDRYYDIFEGPPPPWRLITRILSLGSREKQLKKMVEKALKKFGDIEPSRETIEYLQDKDCCVFKFDNCRVDELKMSADAVSINLGPMEVKGWDIHGAQIFANGGHSPDHIVVYFPKKKFLAAGDLTLEMFPIFPGHSSEKTIIEHLELIQELTKEEMIEILGDGHHSKVFKGSKAILELIDNILTLHDSFKEALISCFDKGKGETIKSLYRKLRKLRYDIPAVDFHLENQFPAAPVFLKTIICSLLLEMGAKIEGSGDNAVFYL